MGTTGLETAFAALCAAVTTVMVFAIQHTQSREQAATQLKQKEKAGAYYAQLLKNCEGIRSDRPELAQAKTLLVSSGGM